MPIPPAGVFSLKADGADEPGLAEEGEALLAGVPGDAVLPGVPLVDEPPGEGDELGVECSRAEADLAVQGWKEWCSGSSWGGGRGRWRRWSRAHEGPRVPGAPKGPGLTGAGPCRGRPCC